MTLRLTARSRLTLLYVVLFLGGGGVLVTLTYLLVRRSMQSRWLLVKGDPSTPASAENIPLPPFAEQIRDDVLSALLTQSGIALGAVTVLAALLGWLLAGRVLRPIRAISATARRSSAESLSERVPVKAPADELAALSETINGMLDRIQLGVSERDQLLGSQRMFVANAAHELRTPLTTIRTAIDVTLDGTPDNAEFIAMATDIRTAAEHSQRILDGLLTLARSQHGPARQEIISLDTVVTRIAAGSRIAQTGLTLVTDLQPAPLHGDPVLIDRLITNLLDNAIRYNRRDGTVNIATGTGVRQSFLRVANTGPLVARDAAARLTEPFFRATRTDDGVGLGLSIVHAITTAHSGSMLITAPETGGLDITITFAS